MEGLTREKFDILSEVLKVRYLGITRDPCFG